MRTYVRVWAGPDPARRPRRLLRVCRAARRPALARQACDRRCGRRPRRKLRGQSARDPDGDARWAGAASLPRGRGRRAPHVGLLGGEQGRVRRVRRCDAARRRTVDRRGVPRCTRHGAAGGNASRDGRAPTPRRARPRWSADHGRRRPDEVPRQGGERCCQTRRPARRTARSRARVSASTPGREALGCWRRHRREATPGRNP